MMRRHWRASSKPFRGLLLLAVFGVAPLVWAHPEARYIQELDWKKDHLAHVLAVGYTELGSGINQSHAEVKQVGERSCVVGTSVGFDVEDTYAFDIDETVELKLTYAPSLTSNPFLVVWDQNAGEGHGRIEVAPESGAAFRTVTLQLPRARFAGQGTRGIDLAVGAQRNGQVAVCDIQIERSGATKNPTTFGRVNLTIKDAATGQRVPARVGIYDATGRAPLPSEDALLVQRFGDKVRLLSVNQHAFWPTGNREAFYVAGTYAAKLPIGVYELAVTRGPEYRAYLGKFEVCEGDKPVDVAVSLERYTDMPRKGWISGDDHVHLQREEVADQSVWQQTAAEDVHVANLLQMGNIAGINFEQPAWGKAGRYTHEEHTLVSGQEDPRTGQLGHTIHENLQKPIRLDSDNYFIYHTVFEESHRQGGVSGFAHLGDWFHAQRGLAVNVPFGEVDFIEVCEAGMIATDVWYGFLNMGYKLTPSAGSDFPYTDLPGVSRNFVKVDHPEDIDAWYASMRAGHTFVTNGPFLEFTVNGHQMGEELHVPRGAMLQISSETQLNPDIDKLDRLELVVEGDVAKTESAAGSDHAVLHTAIKADHSMWLAARAFGNRHEPRNTTEAHSAPIYVIVDDQPFWKAEALPQLVDHEHAALQEILNGPLVPDEDLEEFQTHDLLVAEWPKQREILRARIAQADAMYHDLLKRAGIPPTPVHQ
jgi:hypothetical protein